ncbi:MAG: L-serine ammonia-lyase [Actinomycetaceae bacterium]|nr:L-serine ammonia-lyase [Actinomycetaceae bacterium]
MPTTAATSAPEGPAHVDGPSPAGMIAGHVDAAESARPLSVFDMFRIGIGPSSSHTVGPMRAGLAFAQELRQADFTPDRLEVELFGSLGATGRGHSTDRAVMLGLEGYEPDTVPADVVSSILDRVQQTGCLNLLGDWTQAQVADVKFTPFTVLPYHVNAVTLTAHSGARQHRRTYYSVGGGFVMEDLSDDPQNPRVRALASPDAADVHSQPAPHPFPTAAALLRICQVNGVRISDVVRANEEAVRPRAEVDAYLDLIRTTMGECIDAGCRATGVLPGSLKVARRAAALFEWLGGRSSGPAKGSIWAGTEDDPMRAMDWVNLFALAVNEENAAGHRVVTAPTNGAAGVVPAVLGYLLKFTPEGREDPVGRSRDFLLAATAIGSLIKTNASIAGAEVGCQGEVGSASAMAAAGLCEAFGGTAMQVENAAEIAMEHSLGLTCDPIAGLVQIPCIERNAIAAVKAINAARMAMWGDGRHTVPLDAAIETMWQTGQDMMSKYKETSAGGLAVNVVEC